MKHLKGVSLGDIVELEYRKSFTVEVSKIVGYVKSLDENHIELSTYDIESNKPFNYEIITYEVKDILNCEILKKKE
ncbi:MAG: hypothetical protein KKA65_04790 [Nanoarchaeota archaeon]|nr:hypothetical protein [Nanoarchaeota archaeon]MBU4242061.1 hypothetical protein [Nanoarchaeota archaeon]MBU4351912.1 hypothetical protein [Nanoarchaeota archaeon]MBU4456793.1 hypothetical protein [Nanoarchaeota archaeon]MCG2719351.1 hypothetical protein [Nanoarchaeota archaeon]